MSHEIRIITNSPKETEDLGFRLGRYLKENKRVNVFLYGDLGAGKTTFIKGIASAFGIHAADIGSASFVIVAEYETLPPFYHIDLYRIENERDIDALGIWEYLESGISVVEWADRLPDVHEGAVNVRIKYIDENSREIIIEGINSLE